MLAKAEAKYIRLSPRKARLVLDLIKGKTVEQANYILDNVNKRAQKPIKKVLNSAFANANQNRTDKVLSKDAYISIIRADSGPYLMRYRAATMGRATPIRHRTSHIHVELEQVKEEKPKKAAAKKTSEPKAAKKKKQKKSGE